MSALSKPLPHITGRPVPGVEKEVLAGRRAAFASKL